MHRAYFTCIKIVHVNPSISNTDALYGARTSIQAGVDLENYYKLPSRLPKIFS